MRSWRHGQLLAGETTHVTDGFIDDDAEVGPRRPHFNIDVATTALLYERCSRCMYLHARGGSILPLESEDPDAELVHASLKSAHEAGRPVEVSSGRRLRILSQREAVVSIPVSFPFAEVSYTGIYDAIAESEGRKYLVKYVLPSEAGVQTSRYQRELAALEYALEHPFDAETEPLRVDGHALLSFAFRQVPVKTHVEKQLAPSEWIVLERRPDRFLSFMRVVTCILALEREPPPTPGCPDCKRTRRDTSPTKVGHRTVTQSEAS